MQRNEIHSQLMKKLKEVAGDDSHIFEEKIFKEFELGMNDSSHYNRAVRRLCCSKHEKVIPLLNEILPNRLILNISLTKTNDDGLSAMDYANRNNPDAYALLKKHTTNELTGLVNQGTQKLSEKVEYTSSYSSQLQDLFKSNGEMPALSTEQAKQFNQTVNTTASFLNATLPGLADIHSLPPDQAQKKIQEATAKLLSQISPETNVHAPQKINVKSNTLIGGLKEIIGNEAELQPFLKFCSDAQYEKAIRCSIYFKNQMKALELLNFLFSFKTQLSLDLNTMKNTKMQTPLHECALASNWHVYYTLMSLGANSFIKDQSGMMAQDYRRERQMGFINQTGENPLNQLLSDAGPIDPQKCVIS